MKIQTVCAKLSPTNIKNCMIHEHLVFDLSGVRNDNDSMLSDNPEIKNELNDLYRLGCRTIVEVSNMGMGRDPQSLVDLSQRHHIHVIASTGFYKQEFYPPIVFDKSAEELAELMITDIKEGMDNSSIKAGIIAEIGSSYQTITNDEKKVFEAAILAHKNTGAPISTHCEIGTMGKEQLDIFEKQGVDMNKVSFGHQDLNINMDEQLHLLTSGAYIQFDTIGKNSYRKDSDRVQNFITLIEEGYEDQLMLSCDITRQSHLKGNGGYGYSYMFTNFIPELKRFGITDEIIDKVLTENPRKFLAF